ncbi:MAG: 6,7-dimethyl-8-ribityllumazine synthase [Bacteroidia bacterium]|jgi:6,7-dimethyl-8-ribityllumazine synthase
MSSVNKNLSVFENEIPQLPKARVSIVVAEWNKSVNQAMVDGAFQVLSEAKVPSEQISVCWVPGSFELILGSQREAQKEAVDAVIALGTVIQGETRHFDFICNAVANGIANVSLKYNKPVIFGVLTTDNQQQAEERAGGKHGNKGAEAAYTALRMMENG